MKASIKFIPNSKFKIRSSEFRIWNSEFRIQNSVFRIWNSEFRIQNCEVLLTFKSYLQWYIGPILQCNSYVHNNPYCTDYHSLLGCTSNQQTPMRASYSRTSLYSTEYLNPMEYLQRTPTLQVTHIPHSILCQVGSTH